MVNRGQRGGSGGKSGDNQHSNFSPARKQVKVTAAISSNANSKEDDDLAATLALVQQLQVEEEAAARDRAWALELQSTFRMFECAICMDEKSVEDVFIVDPCNHQYCRECMIGHINAEIGNQHFPIRCPGCPPKSASGGELRQQDLYLLLEHVDYERYLRSTLELHISQTPAILSCPQPDCQGAAEIVPPHTRFICPWYLQSLPTTIATIPYSSNNKSVSMSVVLSLHACLVRYPGILIRPATSIRNGARPMLTPTSAQMISLLAWVSGSVLNAKTLSRRLKAVTI